MPGSVGDESLTPEELAQYQSDVAAIDALPAYVPESMREEMRAKIRAKQAEQRASRNLSSQGGIDAFQYGGKAGAAEADIARFRGMGADAQQRQGVVVDYGNANYDRGANLASRALQGEATNLYRDAALGQGTSVAQASFAAALAAQQREQASMAASARGGGLARAAAQRQAMNNAQAIGTQSAAQMAALRANEIAQARAGMLAGAGQLRGGDLALQGQDAAQAQAQAGLNDAQRGRNDTYQMGMENFGQGVANSQQQGQMSQEMVRLGQVQRAQERADALEARNQARSDQNTGIALKTAEGLASYGGSEISAAAKKTSDEREKKNIKDGTKKALSFLDALKAADYGYKRPDKPETGPGRHTSVMAQDLEKSELGRRMVHDTPEGKVVDYKEGFATMLASMAALNHKISGIEKAFAARARDAQKGSR